MSTEKGYCIETRDDEPPEVKRYSYGAMTFEEARRQVVEYWLAEERKAYAKVVEAVLLRESDVEVEVSVKIFVCMNCRCSIDVPGTHKTPYSCPRCGHAPLRPVADREGARHLIQDVLPLSMLCVGEHTGPCSLKRSFGGGK